MRESKPNPSAAISFQEAIEDLLRGDFSRSEPLFVEPADHGGRCRIVEWYVQGLFANEPKALAEALACACFLGRAQVVRYLLDRGVDIAAGDGTGVNGFHWAASRGQLETVKLLIERGTPLESKNMYGGTVLGMAVWCATHQPMNGQLPIIEALLAAGARLETVGYPTGRREIDDLVERYHPK
jgi:ankyrin repeat protein